jgi:hypothetical protein
MWADNSLMARMIPVRIRVTWRCGVTIHTQKRNQQNEKRIKM